MGEDDGRALTAPGGRRFPLPIFLPVYHPTGPLPDLQALDERHPIAGCIVNAYFLYKRRELRRALVEGERLHGYLGFDGLVMTDSGAFQAFTRQVFLSNRDIVRFQEAIGADVVSPLDLVSPPGDGHTVAEGKVERTARRVREARGLVTRAVLAGVQQGGRFLDLRKRATEDMLAIGVDYLALGSLVPFLTRSHRLGFVREVIRMTRAAVGDLPLHVYGAGDPLELPFLAAWGADVFDSASYAHFANEGWYMTPYGAVRDLGPVLAGEYRCGCSSCETLGPQAVVADRRVLARHNLWTILDTMNSIAEARAAGEPDRLLPDVLERHLAWFPDSGLAEVREG